MAFTKTPGKVIELVIDVDPIIKALGKDKVDEAVERIKEDLQDNHVGDATEDIITEMEEEIEDEEGGEEE